MPRLQILLHRDGWFHISARRLKPDFNRGQIHRWRLRLGPIEIRGWRPLEAPALS